MATVSSCLSNITSPCSRAMTMSGTKCEYVIYTWFQEPCVDYFGPARTS